jgi:CMP-N-acetylneuraminic acid synthetase
VKVLGVITARGGSKGIPGKNLRPLAGKPLIAYTMDVARASGAFDRLIVSTDDVEIARFARGCGCEVPFLRPFELAQDDTPHLPVIQHAVEQLRSEGYGADAVMILQPTSPFRSADDIRNAITLLDDLAADAVVSVSEVPPHYNPMRTVRLDERGFARLFVTGEPVRARINRRQDMPAAWAMNGAVYLCRTAILSGERGSLYGDRTGAYVMSPQAGLSIDDERDWIEAERALGILRRGDHGH